MFINTELNFLVTAATSVTSLKNVLKNGPRAVLVTLNLYFQLLSIKTTTARLIHAMTAKLADFTTSESLVGHSVLPDSRCVEEGKGCVEVSNVAVVEVRVRGRVEDSNAAAQSASFAYMPTQEA